ITDRSTKHLLAKNQSLFYIKETPTMAQDPNQQSQYNQGYAGYTPPQPINNQQYASGQQNNYSADDQYSGSYQQSAYGQQQQQQQQQQYGTYQPPQSVTGSTTAHD